MTTPNGAKLAPPEGARGKAAPPKGKRKAKPSAVFGPAGRFLGSFGSALALNRWAVPLVYLEIQIKLRQMEFVQIA